ncbi:MAG: glycosyl transferase family 2 [Bacteroidetes bacterium GWF2_42_66]|nr:MAG: glycosyl transferase family 2 [Bacteroidetes bacterium GWA2_42_15]OFY02562.1 MAG: glycosyl transferase family 2 [Bacteroidetes bacterium GWE2_42_39]OFY41338.1 MAG: glycosyl transferase family 2 [Bacteroidetes bacterium GWF2_42_66]HAZ04932.1 glycoside hydrolase family 2 [Marinilabiliales bacterium]HBL75463.1 glycoside hydrolase family 2 [Prolixibacteraceae bacterium]
MKISILNILLSCLIAMCFSVQAFAQQTEKQYLSGYGKDNTVNWEFFCTAGRNSGKWTTIPVPSNWECEGFGAFNYGHDKDENRGIEKGLYRYRFAVPESWKSKTVNIVFEGSMTDTEVKVNGKLAGAVHQGSYYQFGYDITKLLKFKGENLLEVTVSKHSANASVNDAERRGDYWIFGGIFRPVYLEAKPNEHITRIALNAKADGQLDVNIYLQNIVKAKQLEARVTTLNGQPVGKSFSLQLEKETQYAQLGEKLRDIKTWTPESPNLYLLELRLTENNQIVHQVSERFGFRTVEIKDRDGIYVNGVKVKFKGTSRFSFWPTSGRTTNKQMSIDDVNLIKEMNMNAVRSVNYPQDVHFMDVCDSLGLFVLDELSGWQKKYDTEVGSKLAREMIFRDINHPSIVIWNNANEGGWNTELDHWFDELDPQKRPVIHPYNVFRKTDTDHYQAYDAGTSVHQHGNKVVFPTEFLHGLYDGGHGAGLEDYWNQMWYNPISAGGFLWDLADQAIVRNDQGGKLDTDGNHAADGIVGPYHEKEGSFYTIKELWSPVFFEKRFITPEFDGQFTVENRYHYTNLKDCRFTCQLVSLPLPGQTDRKIDYESEIVSPDIQPTYKGILRLNLPKDFTKSDVLYITATDPSGREIYTWSWPISLPEKIAQKIVPQPEKGQIEVNETADFLSLSANNVKIKWSKTTGLLSGVQNKKGEISFTNGPVLIEGETTFKNLNHFEENGNHIVEAVYEGIMKMVRWTIYPNGWLKLEAKYDPPSQTTFMGISFDYPEDQVKGMRWMGYGPYRVWKNRMKGNRLDVWEKAYNNTVTGESGYIYPEFKGYHKGFYWVTIQSKEQDFDIISTKEDIFLRMFTPASPKGLPNAERIAPRFPVGDISFMHGINPIGTKIWNAENLGPMSQKNIYSNRRKYYSKDIELYFNFIGK